MSATFHQQLSESLRALIKERPFLPGEKFLTEREIAERFQTSRPTANKALSSLVSAGVLEVRRGAGTFIRDSLLDYDLERLVSFTDKARAAGKEPGTDVLEFRRLTGAEIAPEVAAALQCTGKERLIFMERLRRADRQPVIFERRHVVARLCPKMTRQDAKGSLYAYWTTKCRLAITGADEIIHAVNAPKLVAGHLEVPIGRACFRITATGFVEGTQALWFEETWYRADVYEFRNRIEGLAGTRAAMGRIVE
jgi:GntR family transcriptional regulator